MLLQSKLDLFFKWSLGILIVYYIIRVEVSLFVVNPEIEDRDEVEVAAGRSTKRPSTPNDIYYFIFKRITKKKSDMN
jgi:hypothetical protein